MIVGKVIFPIMNTIMIVDLLNTSMHNTKIKHAWILQFINYLGCILHQVFAGKLAYAS